MATDTETEPNAAPQEQPRTLWMGDLDTWLDEAAIVDLWWQILRKKVHVKVIKPKNPKPESPYMGLTHLGYCFVEFETYDDAQQALALNGQLLPDIAMPSQRHFPNNPDNQKKYFRLNWASGATLLAPIVHSPEYSLFVGDLSASTTEAHLLLFFQKLFPNSIKTVRVMTDPVSGKSRCFGFVRFTDDSERRRALVEMNGAWFGGRPLRVALATPRNASSSRSPKSDFRGNDMAAPGPYMDQLQEYMYMPPGANAPVHGGHPGGPGSSYYYTLPMMGDKANELGYMPQGIPQSIPPQGQPYLDPTNTTVFVGGLSSDVSEQTLLTLFMPFGVIQQIKIPPGKNCGFLKYSTREEAEDAILSMEGFIIGGNRVRLGWGRVSANNKSTTSKDSNLPMWRKCKLLLPCQWEWIQLPLMLPLPLLLLDIHLRMLFLAVCLAIRQCLWEFHRCIRWERRLTEHQSTVTMAARNKFPTHLRQQLLKKTFSPSLLSSLVSSTPTTWHQRLTNSK